MKKLISMGLALSLAASVMAGCGSTTPSSSTPAPSTPATSSEAPVVETPVLAEGELKLGMSVVTSLGKTLAAEDGENGTAQTNIALAAVTVDGNGVIESCVIDAIQSKIKFDANGALVTDKETTFASKNVLGDDYGMRKASAIAKEWNEQAAAFAAYAKGKTVADLRGIAVNEKGVATDADLAASVSLVVADFVDAIEDAVNKAVPMGTKKGDVLHLTSVTSMKKSKDATPDKDGLAQAYATMAATTVDAEGKITACYIDSVQGNVNFNAKGEVTSDIEAAVASKNELGEKYNMKGASAISKEWNEQAAAFCAYVKGKTPAEISEMALTEKGAPADADLATSVTISVGDFMEIIGAIK